MTAFSKINSSTSLIFQSVTQTVKKQRWQWFWFNRRKKGEISAVKLIRGETLEQSRYGHVRQVSLSLSYGSPKKIFELILTHQRLKLFPWVQVREWCLIPQSWKNKSQIIILELLCWNNIINVFFFIAMQFVLQGGNKGFYLFVVVYDDNKLFWTKLMNYKKYFQRAH